MYPKVPVGYLEMQADRELMGRDRASAVMNFWAGGYYRWIYKTVIQDESKIYAVLDRENLEIR